MLDSQLRCLNQRIMYLSEIKSPCLNELILDKKLYYSVTPKTDECEVESVCYWNLFYLFCLFFR